MANSEGHKTCPEVSLKRTCLDMPWRRVSGDGDGRRFGHMFETRGDVQRFGPQAFETRSLRRFIDAGFHFTYTDRRSFCALIQTVRVFIQRSNGLERALL